MFLHLTSHVFSEPGHPGVYRTIGCLAGTGRHVVLGSEQFGYVKTPLSPAERDTFARQDIHIERIPFAWLNQASRVRALLAGLRRRHGRPQAIVGHLGNNGWRAIPLAAAADVPIVTIFHGTDAYVDLVGPEYGWRYRKLFATPGSRVLGVSRAIADHLREHGGPDADTFYLPVPVPVPVPDTPDFAAREPGAPLELALIGRFVPRKGHEVALRALAQLRRSEPRARLTLYGEGPLEERMRQLASELSLEDAVVFRGVVPAETILRELGRFHVYVQPSVQGDDGAREGVPNAILEAMAAGLPVVASRHAGIPEVVDDTTGVLVPEHDPSAVADAVLALAADDAGRRARGAAGRNRIERQFAPHVRAAVLRQALDRAIESHASVGWTDRRRTWRDAVSGLLVPERLRTRLLYGPARLLLARSTGRFA